MFLAGVQGAADALRAFVELDVMQVCAEQCCSLAATDWTHVPAELLLLLGLSAVGVSTMFVLCCSCSSNLLFGRGACLLSGENLSLFAGATSASMTDLIADL